jgi:hypothetical protein
MYYVTSISHPMQQHKFGGTCLVALFLKSILLPPEQEKKSIDVSCPRHTAMHYVTTDHIRCKTQVWHNVSWDTFSRINTGPTRA